MMIMKSDLVLPVALLMIFYNGLGWALQAEIQPDVINKDTKTPVKMSCIPEADIENRADEIIVMKLNKDNKTLITLRRDLKYAKGIETKFQAEGHIDKIVSQSYLRTSLLDPHKGDAGQYECQMYYLDNMAVMKEETAVASLSFIDATGGTGDGSSNLSSLEISLKAIQNQLDMEDRKEKERPAFSAKYTSWRKLKTGDTIVFNEILVNDGIAGYDKYSGVFTAPKAGIYNFQLVAAMGKSNGYISIDVMVDDQVHAGLTAADKDFDDQSSISFLIKLNKGSKVKAVLRSRSGPTITINHANGWTLFSGFLVKE